MLGKSSCFPLFKIFENNILIRLSLINARLASNQIVLEDYKLQMQGSGKGLANIFLQSRKNLKIPSPPPPGGSKFSTILIH